MCRNSFIIFSSSAGCNTNNSIRSIPLENGKQPGSYSTANIDTAATGKSGNKVIFHKWALNLHKWTLIRYSQNISRRRTNTYPKIPERYRLRSTDGTPPTLQNSIELQNAATPNKTRSVSLHGQSTTPLLSKVSPNNHFNSSKSTDTEKNQGKEEEEVIYFWYKPTEVEI